MQKCLNQHNHLKLKFLCQARFLLSLLAHDHPGAGAHHNEEQVKIISGASDHDDHQAGGGGQGEG